MVESLRKDVECLFGQMKQEFAILKYGSRFSSLELMDDIFLVCCALRNQRKVLRGLDQPWEERDIKGEEEDLSQTRAAVFRRLADRERQNEIPEGGMGTGEHRRVNMHNEHENSHDDLKNKLIAHFKVSCTKDDVFWTTKEGKIAKYNRQTS